MKSTNAGIALLEAHTPPGLDQVLASYSAKLGIVTDQVCELPALLNQIAAGEPRDALLNPACRAAHSAPDPNLEAQCLIEVGSQQIVLGGAFAHSWFLW